MRRLDGSFWRKRLQHEQVDPSSSDEEDAGRSASRRRRDGGLFATRHGDIVENEYGLEKWEGYHELTWEPVANIPWQAIREFERETIESV
ncbi:hypothetical protein F441_22967 [Phytophthora nicotianae CJ01A1]|uniref:Chromo domain-containing protein n=2 Tax=Phytophthora nicotianae TaxID=4792 RepID=W2IG25_PHYNI|nr:hypothetical protein L915_14483 [Phytophthora nicotianae]ETL33096.1 hypothetical protein L916_14392 [Phytophthora nicotianae]ETL86368.1 hypothetical protein L917_14197 [Phytophthora nicotianae]ETO99615.1 hypothetical protein F441_22967 [Phytophthora nicotianae CJ01A1]